MILRVWGKLEGQLKSVKQEARSLAFISKITSTLSYMYKCVQSNDLTYIHM